MRGKTLHRFRVGDYRVYFERHELGLVVHRILSRHTLKDSSSAPGFKLQEDEALQQNPKFWELIESARGIEAGRNSPVASATRRLSPLHVGFNLRLILFAQFHVPVGQVDEVLPAVVMV